MRIILCLFFSLCSISFLRADPSILQHYEAVFSQLPNWDIDLAELQPFGTGCTNQNYLLHLKGERYFVRIGSHSKEILGLTFAKEIELIQLASTLGISPPIIVADVLLEIIIFPFIESRPVNLRNKEKLANAIELLKKFHACDKILSFSTTPENIFDLYLKQIEQLDIKLSERQKLLIAKRPTPTLTTLVPCHLDLKGENLLDDGSRLWLIDWEYGGMSDPLFDLATLAPAAGFSEDELNRVLELYTPQPTQDLYMKLKQFRILANLRIALWCLIMSRSSTLDYPYQQWADELFDEVDVQISELYTS
jgi:thiamine kinase-like enzyme